MHKSHQIGSQARINMGGDPRSMFICCCPAFTVCLLYSHWASCHCAKNGMLQVLSVVNSRCHYKHFISPTVDKLLDPELAAACVSKSTN
jgi:hypothetical protein